MPRCRHPALRLKKVLALFELGKIIFHRYLLVMGPRKKIAGIFGMANCKLLPLAIRAIKGSSLGR
jgi:hypothetical protein